MNFKLEDFVKTRIKQWGQSTITQRAKAGERMLKGRKDKGMVK